MCLAHSSVGAKLKEQNPYRLLPAMAMMTSGSLKTFLSRTHGEMLSASAFPSRETEENL